MGPECPSRDVVKRSKWCLMKRSFINPKPSGWTYPSNRYQEKPIPIRSSVPGKIHERLKSRDRRQGVILVNSGDGKGKSSSALGMVFRAAGWDMKVCVIQYIKGQWQTGEQKAAQRFDNIEWHALGDGFTWDTKNPEQDIKTSREIWEFSKQKIRSGEFDLVLPV